jgi:hypothetical protein
MSIPIETKDTDHPEFVALVETILSRLDVGYSPDQVFIIRVRGWFDHKWLNYSGRGSVPFDSPFPDHPQVALDEFFKDQITFPPFTPKRILSQERWVYNDQESQNRLPHKRRYERSAMNLHRRVKDHSKSGIYVWYSSETDKNRRGSVMVYHAHDGYVNTWYSSFLYADSWRLDQTKGIDRDFVLNNIINTEQKRGADGV